MSSVRRSMSFYANQQGFSLLEVLIAISVLAIGVLGMAGLQGLALRASQDSYYRTVAAVLVKDMKSRIEANQEYGDSGTAVYNYLNVDEIIEVDADCYKGTGCTPSEMAENDIYEWRRSIAGALPGAFGIICRHSDIAAIRGDGEDCLTIDSADDCDGAGDYLIVVRWYERFGHSGTIAEDDVQGRCADEYTTYEPD